MKIALIGSRGIPARYSGLEKFYAQFVVRVVAGDASGYLSSGRTVPENVEFFGRLTSDEIGRFYRDARFVVQPSLCHETFGSAVAEALSRNIPVVVTDLGALAEVAGPGGLVVSAGDVAALREAVSRLWNDEELCRQTASTGREYVKRYSDEAYLRNLFSAYEKVRSNGLRNG